MKKFLNLYSIIASSLMLIALVSCEPSEMDASDASGTPPPASVTFTVAVKPENASRFTLTNTTSVNGISQGNWDLGNGSKVAGNSVEAYYPLPGTYKVVLSVTTNLGTTVSDTTLITTTVTDPVFLNNPMNILLSGGIDDVDGKTWVIDSLKKAHFTMGANISDPTNWWNSAQPLEKTGCGMYDDEIILKFNGFSAVLNNNGKSYSLDKFKGNTYFSNPVTVLGDARVDFTPATDYNWSFNPDDQSLTFTGSVPMVFGIFGDPVDGKFFITSSDEHHLVLKFEDSKDKFGWSVSLIEKGFILPTVEYKTAFAATGVTNEFSVSVSDVVLPAGSSLNIEKVTANFGDGSALVETSDVTETLKHVYMRGGKYQVVQNVVLTDGTTESHTYTADVAANHPDYVPFEINMMMLYNDFSEVKVRDLLGENCTVAIVDNPSVINPNKSSKVAHYSKSNQQWANAYMMLGNGYRFNLQTVHTFSVMVYGKAGKKVLLKLENTDMGGDAWTTGTADFIYTIQKDNTWELAVYDFKNHAAGGGNGSHSTSDVTTDATYSKDYYNVVRIMYEPGNNGGDFDFYFDELRGPSVEGIKSLKLK